MFHRVLITCIVLSYQYNFNIHVEYSHLDYYMITVTTAAGFNMTMCGCKTWSRKVQFVSMHV